MKDLVVIGGGGHAKVLISLLKKTNQYFIAGYTDPCDNGPKLGVDYLGTDIILEGFIKDHPDCAAAIGIGYVSISDKRNGIMKYLESLGYSIPNIISPSAIINEDVIIGQGTIISDGVVINSGAVIGNGVIINTSVVIEHDCIIGDYVHVAPGAILCGGVSVGENSIIGAGSTIIQNRQISEKCFIAAGSTIIEDCLQKGLYIGSPGKLYEK